MRFNLGLGLRTLVNKVELGVKYLKYPWHLFDLKYKRKKIINKAHSWYALDEIWEEEREKNLNLLKNLKGLSEWNQRFLAWSCGFLGIWGKFWFYLQVLESLWWYVKFMLDIDGFMCVELGIGYILLYCGGLR